VSIRLGLLVHRALTGMAAPRGEDPVSRSMDGAMDIETTPYSMDRANEALADLAEDRVNGAGVLVNDAASWGVAGVRSVSHDGLVYISSTRCWYFSITPLRFTLPVRVISPEAASSSWSRIRNARTCSTGDRLMLTWSTM